MMMTVPVDSQLNSWQLRGWPLLRTHRINFILDDHQAVTNMFLLYPAKIITFESVIMWPFVTLSCARQNLTDMQFPFRFRKGHGDSFKAHYRNKAECFP